MRYAYPSASDVALRVKTALQAWRAAGGGAARVLFHSEERGEELLALTGRRRGYLRRFRMSRITFRELASHGMIPGVTKSSW